MKHDKKSVLDMNFTLSILFSLNVRPS